MTTVDFETPSPAVTALLRPWLIRLSKPHPALGRPGPICPFLPSELPEDPPSAHSEDLISVVSWRWPARGTTHNLVTMLDGAMDQAEKRWDDDGRASLLQALVITIENMPAAAWNHIDTAHRAAKPQAVDRGLMLGQFHPECPTPSVHNSGFLVNQAPVPLLVLRRMSLHDLLFLHDDPNYFEAYRERFAQRFAASARPPSHLRDLYAAAQRRRSAGEPDGSELNLLLQDGA